jgi:2-methylisocitrate lyase-like PEP mutase family enzyme
MIDSSSLASLAERLRALHHGPGPLVLPNAWDAVTARAVVNAGFPVVATTSSGVARSLGWADREKTPPEEMFAAIARIARAVAVPVTADVESGYGLAEEVLAERLLATGAVGCNLEDSDHQNPGALLDAAQQARRIAALKRAAQAAGVDIVLNARIDVLVHQSGPEADRVPEMIRRARTYLEAGADCVFPILASDEAQVATLVTGIDGPVNVMALDGGPSLARLTSLGVARISFGGRLERLAFSDHERRLAAIRAGLAP